MKQNLLFDEKDKVAYCKIAKVGSNTWLNNFIKLGIYKIQMAEVIIANIIFLANRSITNEDNIHILAPSLWPPPWANLVSAWMNVTSLVIVRHPMARLASVYYNKFVKQRQRPVWKFYIKTIIQEYRQDEDEGEEEDEEKGENYRGEEFEYIKKPTPNEFIKYVSSFKDSFNW